MREFILRVCTIYMYFVYICIYSMYVYIVHTVHVTVCVQESMCVCVAGLIYW